MCLSHRKRFLLCYLYCFRFQLGLLETTSSLFSAPFPFVYSKTTLFTLINRGRLLTLSCSRAGPSRLLSCRGSVIIIYINYHKLYLEPYRYPAPVPAVCRKCIEIRYRLIQYIYDTMYENSICGKPTYRPCSWL